MPSDFENTRLRNIFGADMGMGSGMTMPDFQVPQQAPMDYSSMFNQQAPAFQNIDFGGGGGGMEPMAPSPFEMSNITAPNFMDSAAGQDFMSPSGPMPNSMGMEPMPSQPMIPQEYSVGERMNQLYKPETAASDQYNQLVNQYPQQEQPGMLKKIGAIALASLSDLYGNKQGQEAYAGMTGETQHNRNVVDWKNKVGSAQNAATLERGTNTNERTMAYQTVSQELKQQADTAARENNEKKAAIAADRAEVYRLKALQPNLKVIMTKGGNVMLLDPTTGKLEDTGRPTGSMTDADKMSLTQEHAVAKMGLGDKQKDENETLANERALERDRIRAEYAKELKGIPSPNTSVGKEPSASQTKVALSEKARQIKNTNPELSSFIKIDKSGGVSIQPPATGMFSRGPTQAQFDELNKLIYPGQGGPTKAAAASIGQGTDRIDVYKNGVKAGTVPRNQLELAKKKGYTVGG